MNKFITVALSAFVAFTQVGFAWAENVAIVGGRVVTMGEAGVIENGTVIIERGRIAAVGADVTVPEGYRIIDATGKYVTPGLMNSATTIGLEEVSLEGSTVDHTINSGSPFSNNSQDAPFDAAFDVSYAYNPNATLVAVTRMEGVTRAMIVPNFGASIFGGNAALVDLSGNIDSLPVAGVAMTVGLGSSGGSHAGGSRAGAMSYLIRALAEAESLSRRGVRSLPTRERDSVVSQIDAEALIPVVKGERRLLAVVSRASDIVQTLRLLDRFSNIKLVIYGAEEGWMVANKLAAKNVPVIIDPQSNLPSTFDSLASTYHNASRLVRSGVKVAFVANGAGGPRLLPQSAGIAVAHGMAWGDAMAAITINPAEIFGINSRYGSLERGKEADVVVWDGDPLEVMSAPTAVFIKGQSIELTSRQTELRDRYLDLNPDMPFAYVK
ncbi:MAG: amidohydrolase family protein [Sphingomonadales bacterium]|nr:amidohydrolase family protein [Sphingomonadales bacterium]